MQNIKLIRKNKKKTILSIQPITFEGMKMQEIYHIMERRRCVPSRIEMTSLMIYDSWSEVIHHLL